MGTDEYGAGRTNSRREIARGRPGFRLPFLLPFSFVFLIFCQVLKERNGAGIRADPEASAGRKFYGYFFTFLWILSALKSHGYFGQSGFRELRVFWSNLRVFWSNCLFFEPPNILTHRALQALLKVIFSSMYIMYSMYRKRNRVHRLNTKCAFPYGGDLVF